MPIAPHLRKFYGHTWRTVTRPAILRRFGGVFSDDGTYLGAACCAKCGVPDVYPVSKRQRSRFECAHLSGDASDASESNTAAMCRRCHRAVDYASWAVKFRAWQVREIEERKRRKDAERPLLVLMEASE